MEKRWLYREYDSAGADRLQDELGLSRLTAVLLAQRGLGDPADADRFLNPSIDQLHDPFRMLGMREAVERLERAIASGERILIYGDYDVDGTSAIVVLRKAIELAGGSAEFFVPHRIADGYGMREAVIERAARDDVRLLISVDNGIREKAVVERARELGIDTIITDHHLPEEELPRALAVLNPNQPGCPYPDKNLAGVGVAFKLSEALLSRLGWPAAKLRRVLESMLKMAAIGTVADIVPLLGENRVIAKLGLAGLARPTNPGLKALIDVAGLKPNCPLTAYDVGFRLGPRINAAGRMDTARDVIDLFTTDSSEEADRLAQKLNGLNAERQQTEAAVVAEILEQIGEIPPSQEMPFVVVAGAGWHAGVIGIVASRVVERYHRPTLILSIDEATGMATGSGRTIKAYHILDGLDSAAELFERYGGHQHAAGCSIAADRIPELTRRLCVHAGEALRDEDFVPTLTVDARLNLSQIEDSLMAELERLEPHGSGNPAPVFSCDGLHLAEAPRALKEKHLRLKLANGKAPISAIGWRMGHFVGELAAGMRVDAAFSVEEDAYWGGWRLNLKDLKPQAGAAGASR